MSTTKNTKTYIVLLGGRAGNGGAVRVQANNKVEAKKLAKTVLPAHQLGGAMVYTLVSIYREEEMHITWDEQVRRNRGTYIDLTK